MAQVVVPPRIRQADQDVLHAWIRTSESRRKLLVARFLRRRLAVLGLVLLLLIAAAAVFAPWLSPHDPDLQNINQRLMPPAWEANGSLQHVLGTDQVGRDLTSRVLYGARVSLALAFLCSTASGIFGIALGLLAGLGPTRVGQTIMRVADGQQAFPFLVVAIAVVGAFGASLANLVIILSIFGWVQFARVVRGDVLAARGQEYVRAAESLGASKMRIALRHILPNVLSPVIVLWTFLLAQIVVIESSLSFLGLGVRPPTASWGSMLADSREYLDSAWWMGTFPGLAIVITVVAVNLLGDGLRDLLDPRDPK